MYILIIHRLSENFEQYDNEICPSDWDYITNIVPFTERKEAIEYLKRLKKEYHAKGKTTDGAIHGRKVIRYDDHYYTKTIETIHTELKELEFGEELEVASEHDTGECPFGEN